MKGKIPKYHRSEKDISRESIDALLAESDFWLDTGEFDRQIAARNINTQLGSSILSPRSKVRKLAVMKYAAVFLVLIMATLGWYWYQLPVHIQNEGSESHAYILPDDSEVLLGRGSSLEFQRDFAKKSREIKLEGKAFFNVKKDTELPFELAYLDQHIKVFGTEFIVEAGHELTQVYLLEGSILWQSQVDAVVLEAGEKLEFSSGKYLRKVEEPTQSHPLLGQELLIDNWTLAEAIDKINQIYDKDVIILEDRENANTCRIHTRFRTGQLDEFIEELELLFKIKTRSYKGSFIIEEINCNS